VAAAGVEQPVRGAERARGRRARRRNRVARARELEIPRRKLGRHADLLLAVVERRGDLATAVQRLDRVLALRDPRSARADQYGDSMRADGFPNGGHGRRDLIEGGGEETIVAAIERGELRPQRRQRVA